ncbi:hypothetical protein ACH5RR_018877 [Cinchona calisaya]|uniref:Lysine-specific demethylase ELF6 n=1 Tax=Cinchona calisaya TaxID=153742 RepID=A0ABD2ZSW1_9GENT
MRDVEIPKWLEGLPLAPEFRPTDTEFADPIGYISKIEKKASAFGICKVIPPLPKPSKKYVLYNLNKSLSKCPELGSEVNVGSSTKMNDGVERSDDSGARAVFTTRHQELGQSVKRVKEAVGNQSVGSPKQVWQSGEIYTLEQFEAKSKIFAKSQLGVVKEVSPLVIEAMFWKAASEKPIYVEYANDVPGSGFGEPEGPFQYYNRRRRRRRKRGTFDRNNQGTSCSNDHVDKNGSTVNCSRVDKDENVSNLHSEVSGASICLLSMPLEQSEIFSEGNLSNASNEMHGTAGWKLSNSPWNLQVIARSPGSLTRYMPDDIPGVTSPMVYVGMLFSWFAWHVEDHELHSLNFLHSGSPKTWYAVPGDYAYDFEEVTRLHAYGGNTNPLDALTLLGEKTTLFSPEVIVAAGIPCCRLVQNPGEFVVTFPRAYHVGFSHGFNCGEAANFSTPKWLTVAKEAAVRRAAMNYLPMLSHQQLLYLLTMSFVSRVPRSLLPGARSSRLKDRQKEERELSVKKAFIEDILKENRLLTILLQKNPSYRVVLWDVALLPASNKGTELCSGVDSDGMDTREDNHPDKCDNQDLYTQMSLYMDSLTDFYVDDADDLQNDYQVDSGTLPCVACGILGFPFMAVVQPSEQASRELLPEDQDIAPQLGVPQPVGSKSLDLDCRAERPTSEAIKLNEENFNNHPDEASLFAESSPSTSSLMKEDQLPNLDHLSSPGHVTVSSAVKPDRGWNLSTGYLRPQLFCLEHAIETVELLRPEGGANVLGICHSDFQKIKAHSAVVAEEIGTPFIYNEIPFGNASQEDLYLIDHAIDNQEKDECELDWTSKLNINLRHCVKMRKNFPSKKVKHALTLGGLFSDTVCNLKALKWQSRKSRSIRKSNPTIFSQLSPSIQTEKVEEPVGKLDSRVSRKHGQLMIQYYRKRYKSCGSEGVSKATMVSGKHSSDDFSAGDGGGGYHNEKERDLSQNTLARVESAGNSSSGLSFLAYCRKSKLPSEDHMTLSGGDLNENPSPSKLVDSSIATTSVAENIDAHTENHICEELIELNKNYDSPLNESQKLSIIHAAEETTKNHDVVNSENCGGSLDISVYDTKNTEVMRENEIVSEINMANRICDLVETDESERQCHIQADGDVPIKEATEPAQPCPRANDYSVERCNKHIKTTALDECGMISGKVQKMQPIQGDDQERSVSSNPPLSIRSNHTLTEELEAPVEMPADDQQHGGRSCLLFENRELNNAISTLGQFPYAEKARSKRKREVVVQNEDQTNFGSFTRSPCEGLRPRIKRGGAGDVTDSEKPAEDKRERTKVDKHSNGSALRKDKKEQKKGFHRCSIDGCKMSFQTKAELVLHIHNRCPVKGCGKKFFSHKYAITHQRVHDDDRPLKCPWKGCTMTFKWAWARTEHIRVHTGERPYKCKVEGCGLTFRFVSDFSRHRRKTGHYVN